MDEALKKQLMSELGSASAKARKEKQGDDFMLITRIKGVGARQKNSPKKFEMITHPAGNGDSVEHKKGWDCGLQNCSEKNIKDNRTVKKTKPKEVKKDLNMGYTID